LLVICGSGDWGNVTSPCVWVHLTLVVSLDLQDWIVKRWKNVLKIWF